jgi:hypothetical protein
MSDKFEDIPELPGGFQKVPAGFDPFKNQYPQPKPSPAAPEPPPNFPDEAVEQPKPKSNGAHGKPVIAPQSQSTPDERFPTVWLDDAEYQLSCNDYVKHIIGRKANVLIYGPSGDGKTFFTGDLLAHIASGQQWRGIKTTECLVVYVAAEAGTSILRRMVAWRDNSLAESRETRTPFVILTRGANILDINDMDLIMAKFRAIEAVAGMPIGIIAFDTLSRSMPGGDENAAKDITRVVAVADHIRDELNATTVFVHHTGKDDTRGARGHSSLYAAADTVISVIDRTATLEKSRDGLTGDRFSFDLEVINLGNDQDGDAITTCLVKPTNTVQRSKIDHPMSGVAKVALQSLKECVAEHGEVMPGTSSIPKGSKAVEIGQWRSQFALRYGGETQETNKKAFQRGREALLKRGDIGISGTFCWLF